MIVSDNPALFRTDKIVAHQQAADEKRIHEDCLFQINSQREQWIDVDTSDFDIFHPASS